MENQLEKTKRKRGNPNWKPGVSGNPKGKPMNAPIVAPAVRKLLEMTPKEIEHFRPRTVVELMAFKQVRKMLLNDDDRDNLRRFEALTNRIEGHPVQPTQDMTRDIIVHIDEDDAKV